MLLGDLVAAVVGLDVGPAVVVGVLDVVQDPAQ